MSLDYIVKPITGWPGKRRHGTEQRQSPFGRMVTRQFSSGTSYQSRERGATWSKILSTLERELRHLHAVEVTMRLDVRPDQIRIDGGVKSNASPATSAVMLEFQAAAIEGWPRLIYKCDVFRDWQSNLYAIAKSLEALRLVDRYEVATAGEQYAGFKQIAATSTSTINAEAAAQIIAKVTDYRDPRGENILRFPETAKELLRGKRSHGHTPTATMAIEPPTTALMLRGPFSAHTTEYRSDA